MKNNHNIAFLFRLSCALVVVLMSLEPLMLKATDQLSVDGSFVASGYNNPIELSALALTQWNAETSSYESVTTLVPTQTYRISFTVSDLDSLDWVLIEVGLMLDESFDDADGNGVDDGFESAGGINANGDQFDFTYNRSMSEPTLFLQPETNVVSSWSLVRSNVSALEQGAITHDFTFDFSVSKAASVGSWALNVRVSDDYNENPRLSTDVQRLQGIAMAWYGELAFASQTGFNWGEIKDRSTDYTDTLKRSLTLITTANGAYQRLVKADTLWEGIRTQDTAIAFNESTLDARLVTETSTQPSQSFAIRINESDLETQGATAGFLQLTGTDQILFQSSEKTTELGNTQAVHAYIQLSSQFQNGSYTGMIHFGLSNLPN